MWAVGVIMYILLCGFPPFASASKNQRDLFEKIKAGRVSFPMPYWQGVAVAALYSQADISESAKSLVCALLQVDRTKRMTADALLQHPWIVSSSEFDTLSMQSLGCAYRPGQRRQRARFRWHAALHKLTAVRRFPLKREQQ